MNENKFAYIGRKSCGCVMGVATDNGDNATALHVYEFIQDGLTVDRVPWAKYREIAQEDTFMNCPHGQLGMKLK
jgi:hypothetical protein